MEARVSTVDIEETKGAGVPDAVELLKQDHRKVEGLFERYQGGDRNVVKQICDELTLHTTLEEQHVYPLLPEVSGGDQLRQEAEKEHQEVKEAIQKVEQAGSDGDIEQPMQAIIEGVTHHVQEEESEVLPKLAQELGEERMESLGARLQEAKQHGKPSDGENQNLDDLSKSELYERAQAANVTGRSNMNKEQLREALRS
jgi:hemerythrin superfamily protein